MLFWYSNYYFVIRTESKNRILTIKIIFWHSKWVGKCYFDSQITILAFELSRKIVFWQWNPYFDIRTEPENAILIFKILFSHSNWVGKSYFHVQNPKSENDILIFYIQIWHSNWVGKLYFDIQNSILTFELSRKMIFRYSKSYFDIRTESENRILTFKILFWHSNWVAKSYFDIQNPILTFELSRKIVFWHLKSYFDIRTESENDILI